ncbi:hypothetical protein QTP86_004380 [Hemibagrus guttatus]|nr:hypothetical protein QTP86_004380 [Hemibagrus guttatus]
MPSPPSGGGTYMVNFVLFATEETTHCPLWSSPSPCGVRHHGTNVAKALSVCLSSSGSAPGSPRQSVPGPSSPSVGGSTLAYSDLVCGPEFLLDGNPWEIPVRRALLSQVESRLQQRAVQRFRASDEWSVCWNGGGDRAPHGCGVWAAVVSIYQKWSKERTVGHEHKTEGRKLKGIQRSTETGLAVEMPSRTVRQASHESIEDSMNSYGSEGNIWCPASDKKIGDPLTQIWAESQVLQLVVSVEEIIVLNAEL